MAADADCLFCRIAAALDAGPRRPRGDRRGRARPGALTVRAAAAAILALALLPAAASGQEPGRIVPTFQLDAKRDVRGPLDLVRVAMSRRPDGRLRGEVTMRRAWGAAELQARDSVCLKLYVAAEPDAEPPEYLVCITAPREGDRLIGRVLRNRANGLPRTVARATVTRPSGRTAFLRFTQRAIGRPASVRFSAESLTHGERCPAGVGCMDVAPDAPATRMFRLRPGTSAG
jgi:hypothetical protein